jgi:hypothetical protein
MGVHKTPLILAKSTGGRWQTKKPAVEESLKAGWQRFRRHSFRCQFGTHRQQGGRT